MPQMGPPGLLGGQVARPADRPEAGALEDCPDWCRQISVSRAGRYTGRYSTPGR